MKKYQDFKKVQEVRTRKKCPVLSFKPIRDSEIFTDMIGMGFVEALPDKPAGIETEGPSEQRNFKDRLGNIAFFHPEFESHNKPGYPQYNIMHNGSIRVVTGPSKSSEFPRLSTDLKRTCMTVEDYLYKMNFLVKYLVRYQGFPINDSELYNEESYKDLIDRKMKLDPSVVKNIKILPPSLSKTDLGKGASALKRFGAFGDDED
jgi:hypothetical protein